MPEISLPNEWHPMQHQVPVWTNMQNGVRRAALLWHRRAGKDSFAINYLATVAHQKVGVYWHMLPTATQARKVIWNGVDRYGRRVIDQAVPPALREKTSDQEMFIRLKNGSVIQLVGSDNFDSLVGSNPIGVVFSEYAIANPMAWAYIRPILRENGGWAVFISTARGRNHFYRLYDTNKDNPNWFCQTLTVDDTFREDGTPIMTPDDIAEERREGMDESMVQQEYYCSWEGGLQGAYYTDEVNDIRDNRMGSFDAQDGYAMTAWDIGVADKTAIGVFMRHPTTGAPILMDAYEDRNKGLAHYIRHVRKWQQENYLFHYHFGPHDLAKTEWTSNNRVIDTAHDLGISFDMLQTEDLLDGIDRTRSFLRKLYVNENDNTLNVLDMLQSYRRDYDEKNQVYKDKPLHDFSSDTADMIRYAAQAWHPSLLMTDTSQNFKAKRAIGR
jgi:hypothetical protein